MMRIYTYMIYRSYIYIHDVYIFMYIPAYTGAVAVAKGNPESSQPEAAEPGEGPGGFEGQNPNV